MSTFTVLIHLGQGSILAPVAETLVLRLAKNRGAAS
jgi:hypothetical protein